MSQIRLTRRELLQGLATGAAMMPLVPFGTAVADGEVKLDEADPAAKALGYMHDASKVDPKAEAAFKPGSACHACALYQGAQAKNGFAPCAAFPGKLVAAAGWCRAFTPKPA